MLKQLPFFAFFLSLSLTPLTAQWSSTQLSVGRFVLAAAESDGKVLFAGGGTLGFIPSKVVDIYDLNTGQWTKSELSQARHAPAAVAADGKIYIGGGVNLGSGASYDALDIYDVAANTWTTGKLSAARGYITALKAGRKLLFVGGVTVAGNSDVIDLYDLDTKIWSVQKMPEARVYPATAVVGNKVYIAGGADPANNASNRIDVYDVTSNTWETRSMPTARILGAAVTAGGKIFFAGGQTETSELLSQVDIYDLATAQWTTAELSAPRSGIQAGVLCGKIIFAGGGSVNWATRFISASSDVIDIYDLATGTWTTHQQTFAAFGAAAVATNEKFITGGGWKPPSNFNNKVDIFTCQPVGTNTAVIKALHLFPNPATDHLMLEGISETPTSAVLTGLDGKTVKTWSHFEAAQGLSVRGIAPGMYILQVQGEREWWQGKVVVER